MKGRVREAVRGAPDPPHRLVFDPQAVSQIDATGSEALQALALDLRRDGIGLVVARMKPYVQRLLADAGVTAPIGEDRFFPTVRAAVASCLEDDACE